MITARLTAENATSAPKLIIDARVVRSITTASSEISDTRTIAVVGVLYRAESTPNTRRGKIPSRPMLKRMRDTEACEASADPAAPAT